MDKLKLTGLTYFGYHGVKPEETKLGQRFSVSLTLELDTLKAGLSDDIRDSVDYADVAHFVGEIVGGKPRRLIESVAEHIAAGVLEKFPPVQAVTVELHKPHPPVPVPFGGVTVEIRRERTPKR